MYLCMSITLTGSGKDEDKFYMLFFTCQHKEIYVKYPCHSPLFCTLKYKRSCASLQKSVSNLLMLTVGLEITHFLPHFAPFVF